MSWLDISRRRRPIAIPIAVIGIIIVPVLMIWMGGEWFPCVIEAKVDSGSLVAKAIRTVVPTAQACGGGGVVGSDPGCEPNLQNPDEVDAACPSKITVTYPNGGEILYINHPYTIRWSSENVSGNVKIERLLDGVGYDVLFANTPNDGVETWNVAPDILRTTFKIRITSIQNTSVKDSSDGNFAIADACDAAAPSDQCENYVIFQNPNGHNVRWAAATAAAGIHYRIKAGTNADMALLIEGSFQAWELEGNGKIRFIRDADGPVPNPADDGVSTVAFGTITAPNEGWYQDEAGNWAYVQSSVNAAGVTTGKTWAWNDPNTGMISDVDTVLNDSLAWDDLPPADLTKYWIPNTMVHEVGHWLDLADLCSDANPNCGERELTMYYAGGGLGITKYTSLGYGDIAGLKALYP